MKLRYESWHRDVYVILDGEWEQVAELEKMIIDWELKMREVQTMDYFKKELDDFHKYEVVFSFMGEYDGIKRQGRMMISWWMNLVAGFVLGWWTKWMTDHNNDYKKKRDVNENLKE